jgi:hypothetical protein
MLHTTTPVAIRHFTITALFPRAVSKIYTILDTAKSSIYHKRVILL